MAITAGIDAGTKNTKVVILDGTDVRGRGLALTGFDPTAAVASALSTALTDAGIEREGIERIVATGAGRKSVTAADDDVPEVTADARAAIHLLPEARTVVDVGAEEGRGISIDERGTVVDFAVNERCAAGAGAFTEAMGRALELETEAIGPVSLQSTQRIKMNAECTVFAESELVTLLHANTPVADIARAVHDAIAARIASLVRQVRLEPTVVLVGGVGNNIGFQRSLEEDLGVDVTVPDLPEYATAFGAALIAAVRAGS